MRLRFIPITGVLLDTVLLAIALARFSGYDWTHDYISTVLRSAPDRRLPADVRIPAIAGILCLSAAIGLLFYQLSVVAPSGAHAKLIQIGGIASAVYQSLTPTPMHDLMVTLSFFSFLVAAGALAHWLYLRRAGLLLLLGVLSLAVLGVSGALYFTGSFGSALSVGQKISLFFCTAWLLLSHAFLTRGMAKPRSDA